MSSICLQVHFSAIKRRIPLTKDVEYEYEGIAMDAQFNPEQDWNWGLSLERATATSK